MVSRKDFYFTAVHSHRVNGPEGICKNQDRSPYIGRLKSSNQLKEIQQLLCACLEEQPSLWSRSFPPSWTCTYFLLGSRRGQKSPLSLGTGLTSAGGNADLLKQQRKGKATWHCFCFMYFPTYPSIIFYPPFHKGTLCLKGFDIRYSSASLFMWTHILGFKRACHFLQAFLSWYWSDCRLQ